MNDDIKHKHSFFTFVPHGTRIDFVGNGKNFLIGSFVVLGLSLLGLAVRGINWGVEFVGGTEIQVAFADNVGAQAIRETLDGAGFVNVSVQQFGSTEQHEFLIRVQRVSVLTPESVEKAKASIKSALGDMVLDITHNEREGDRINVFLRGTQAPAPVAAEGETPKAPDPTVLTDTMLEPNGSRIETAVRAAGLELRPTDARRSVLGQGREEHLIFVKGISSKVVESLRAKFTTVTERRTDYVDATVADELRTDGILAMLYALGVILLYIAIRFDFYFSPGAVAGLAHDVLVSIGVVAWTGLDFDLTLVAAFLTIIGYSINDTIVVYDRVREVVNANAKSKRSLEDMVNESINDTLSRTILTSLVTFLVSASLLIFGGRVLHGFALAMCVGIVTGTYSSFAISVPTFLWLKRKFPDGFLPASPAPDAKKA
jgi:preprotein translocase subunit SecF